MTARKAKAPDPDLMHWEERVDLAAAFRWTARLNMHGGEGAVHFSLVVEGSTGLFLMNPIQRHFLRIRASHLRHIDPEDPDTLSYPGTPGLSALTLHRSLHRRCKHAVCVMQVHSPYATILATLIDSTLQPIDESTATFYSRHVVDEHFGGVDLEEEGDRCAMLLSDPKVKVLVRSNHGVVVIGDTVADTFHRLCTFERAAHTYIGALQSGWPLRILPHEIAERIARDVESFPELAYRNFTELKTILDEEGSRYST